MKKEMLIFLFLVIFIGGCSHQTTEIKTGGHISVEFIGLNERECKSNAFEEIEPDIVGSVYGGTGSGLAFNDINNDGLIEKFNKIILFDI